MYSKPSRRSKCEPYLWTIYLQKCRLPQIPLNKLIVQLDALVAVLHREPELHQLGVTSSPVAGDESVTVGKCYSGGSVTVGTRELRWGTPGTEDSGNKWVKTRARTERGKIRY